MIRRPPRSTLSSSSAASDVYKRQVLPYAPQNLHLFDPTTVTPNNEHPLAQIPDAPRHITTTPPTSQEHLPQRSQGFNYRTTTNRLPQVPIVLPILNDPSPPQTGRNWPIFPDLPNFLSSIRDVIHYCKGLTRNTLEELEDALQITTQALRTPSTCLLYTSPSPRDRQKSRMPSSA